MHKMNRLTLALIGAGLMYLPSLVQASTVSDFDSSTEGWYSIGATAATFSPTGGNPDGRIYATDNSASAVFGPYGWGFFSPPSWSGDWSSYIGGSISFDLLLSGYNRSGTSVVLLSGSNYISQYINTPLIGSNWSSFQTELVPANFTEVGASFEEIVSNVTALYIQGDLTTSFETASLDNVSVTPVPIPAAIWLFMAGMMPIIGRISPKRAQVHI